MDNSTGNHQDNNNFGSKLNNKNNFNGFSLESIDHLSVESGSDESEILDPFEKYHSIKLLKPLPGTYVNKTNVIKNVADNFTEDVKQLMKEIQEEDGLNGSLFDEESIRIDKKLLSNFENITVEIQIPDKKEDDEFSDDDTEITVESNTWQLLKAHSNPIFEMTPPNYNLYNQPNKNWLERPGIPWSTVNFSTLKCDRWLTEHFNKE